MSTISLAMIIKDEEAVLDRCLASICECIDEIIIVDTGSSDQSVEIAERYTKQIYHYTWNDDFASARNEAFSHAKMDYIMWMDADDVLPAEEKEKLLALKQTLTLDTDIVMMKYHIAFDNENQPTFTYYRERLIRNNKQFYWSGRIHEAINIHGKIAYNEIAIHHKKLKQNDSMRNLRILEKLCQEERATVRDRYYYARELYEHQQYQKALLRLEQVCTAQELWIENKIDSYRIKGHCLWALNRKEEALASYFHSFVFALPKAEILCDIAYCFMQEQNYKQAIYWYHSALHTEKNETSGAFIQQECYDFIPYVQLCVCYDCMGEHEKALYYHQQAAKLKPTHPIVQKNNEYFKAYLTK